MIFRTPHYYSEFRCIADKCKDNCCIGWEIDIDDETAEKYKSITGEFGKLLNDNIDFSEQPCFILGENERCPFLNNRNLCDIITELGENCLCQICDDHPRYYEWFGNIKEGGVGLCCEEAARIILNSPLPFSYVESEIEEDNFSEVDEKMFSLVFNIRDEIFSVLNDENCPINIAFSRVMEIVEDYIELPENHKTTKEILEFMTSLEAMDENWLPTLKNALERFDELNANKKQFTAENPNAEKYMRNLAIYYIWRHFLKAAFDGEIYSRAAFAIASTNITSTLWELKWLDSGISADDFVEIAKNYSKEIEYSEDNTYTLLEVLY